LRPYLTELEQRVVLSYSFPEISGITFDTSGDVFVSYDSTTRSSIQQQSVAEVGADGYLVSADVFTTSGSSAVPGVLTTVGSSASLPGITNPANILELEPNGDLFDFNPSGGGSTTPYDVLSSYAAGATHVYDVQTGSFADLSGKINLADATYGDFGVYDSSLVVSAESNDWDFVMRVTYASQVPGTATILVASPASDGLTAAPGGVAVGPQGTVLATLPYLPSGATTAIHVPVGFNLFYDQGNDPQPLIPSLGLTTLPDMDSAGITVDSEDNFILALTDSSLYGGGAGVAHVNSALTAFLADPITETPNAITYQEVDGTNYLALTEPDQESYQIAGELPLFSGQVTPDQLRSAYGINQISFTGPDGTTVAGTGAGQTIAIVEEGVDPTLEADLETFDQFFDIPNPPSFQVVDQNGVTTENDSIVGEASLDVEWAHAIAPDASIIVYDAAYEPNDGTTSYLNLIDAMHEASLLPGVSVVTLSYGEPEYALSESGITETQLDSNFTTTGVTFLAASGDSGAYGDGGNEVAVNYPSASPDVVSVGGTSIVIDSAGDYPGTGSTGEIGWGSGTSSGSDGGSGGGLSTVEPEPAWQTGVVSTNLDSTGARALPDVAMDSGVAQEYDVFTSTLSGSSVSANAVGWLGDAGTSAASPIWAGLIAIANQGRALAGGTPLTGYTQTLSALYSLPSADFHDILHGSNGYTAGAGYDLVTGLGTPVANLLVPALASYQLPSQVAISTEPPSTIGTGELFGFQAKVEDSSGDAVSGGSVTIALTNPDGAILGGTLTAPIVDGTATFTDLSLNQPGTFTLTATITNTSISTATKSITVTQTTNASRTVVTGTSSTIFGQAITLEATVSVVSPGTGVPTGDVTFTDGASNLGTLELSDGVARLTTTPAAAGTETITITYGGSTEDQPSSTTFVVTIAPATPTLTWGVPASLTAGTPLSAAELDATASFEGAPLDGQFHYSPAIGTILAAGNGQILTVTFEPTNATDFKAVTASVPINVVAPAVSTTVEVVGEQALFERKPNKKGKPAGKAVLTGFAFRVSGALDALTAENAANYQLDTVTTRKVKKKTELVRRPITKFTVSYNPADDEIDILLTAKQTFPTGGQITIGNGVIGEAGAPLSGTTVFTITKGGKGVEPA
jgi:hypothetical protein